MHFRKRRGFVFAEITYTIQVDSTKAQNPGQYRNNSELCQTKTSKMNELMQPNLTLEVSCRVTRLIPRAMTLRTLFCHTITRRRYLPKQACVGGVHLIAVVALRASNL